MVFILVLDRAGRGGSEGETSHRDGTEHREELEKEEGEQGGRRRQLEFRGTSLASFFVPFDRLRPHM